METIYETYSRVLCSNCKNRTANLCNIRKNIRGNLQCIYYEKDKEVEKYKEIKPLMRLNI